MHRAVLDTNVLVSSLASETGAPAQIYRAWRNGLFVLVTSRYILEEFIRVAQVKLGYTSAALAPVLNVLYHFAEFVQPAPVRHSRIKKNDWPILGTAAAGQADFLVTGDRELLRLKRFDGIPIITPRDFIIFCNTKEKPLIV